MEFTRAFSGLNKTSADLAGGKGASLGEMLTAGIPVPYGFVVLAGTFEHFIKETDLVQEIDSILDAVDHKAIHTVDEASEKIRALILSKEMPEDIKAEILNSFSEMDTEFVAVRSSATAEDGAEHAWAGQLESYLNVTKDNVLEKVQHCWSSLFTPRAIFYRFEKGLHSTHISVAVVVQKMVNSELSGIAFSVHPVTEDYNQMIIEAGFGLGEAIVSGSITPDSYVVEKEPRNILDINVSSQTRALYRKSGGGNEWKDLSMEEGGKQVLEPKQILELGEIIMRIENHYGFPCDIEWAFEKEKFYIVQSRPITTLSPKKEVEKPREELVFNENVWKLVITRNMSFWHSYISVNAYYNRTKDFGVDSNLEILAITEDGTKSHIFMYPEMIKSYNAAVLDAVSTRKKIEKLKSKYEDFANELLASLEKCLDNLNEKTLAQFLDKYEQFVPGLNITAFLGRCGLDLLTTKLKEKGMNDEELPEVIGSITYPEEHTPLFNSQLDLIEIGKHVQQNNLSQGEIDSKLEKWLEKHGYIPVNFCDEPWTISDAKKQLASLMQKDCAAEHDRLLKDHEEKVSKREKDLKKIGDEEIETIAFALAEGTYLNEFRKNVFSRVSLGYRPIFNKIAELGGAENWRDCFYLAPDEMLSIISGEKISISDLREKRKVAGVYIKNGDRVFMSSEEITPFHEHLKSLQGEKKEIEPSVKSLKGFSANKGKITAVARIILSSNDFDKLNPGEVLVTTMTSVDFVPVMERAGAFITNEGGITSHAAIVAREMNKPCILGTGNATQVLRDGDLVEVDADKGFIRVLERVNEY